jgi:hypothetical protein
MICYSTSVEIPKKKPVFIRRKQIFKKNLRVANRMTLVSNNLIAETKIRHPLMLVRTRRSMIWSHRALTERDKTDSMKLYAHTIMETIIVKYSQMDLN